MLCNALQNRQAAYIRRVSDCARLQEQPMAIQYNNYVLLLSLLLRAFYSKCQEIISPHSIPTQQSIEPNMSEVRHISTDIDSPFIHQAGVIELSLDDTDTCACALGEKRGDF